MARTIGIQPVQEAEQPVRASRRTKFPKKPVRKLQCLYTKEICKDAGENLCLVNGLFYSEIENNNEYENFLSLVQITSKGKDERLKGEIKYPKCPNNVPVRGKFKKQQETVLFPRQSRRTINPQPQAELPEINYLEAKCKFCEEELVNKKRIEYRIERILRGEGTEHNKQVLIEQERMKGWRRLGRNTYAHIKCLEKHHQDKKLEEQNDIK